MAETMNLSLPRVTPRNESTLKAGYPNRPRTKRTWITPFALLLGLVLFLLTSCSEDSAAYVEDMCMIDCTESQACWFSLWRDNALPDDKEIPVSGATEQYQVEAQCRERCKDFWGSTSTSKQDAMRSAWNACTDQMTCDYVSCVAPCCLEQACTFSGEQAGESCEEDGDLDLIPDADGDDEQESEIPEDGDTET